MLSLRRGSSELSVPLGPSQGTEPGARGLQGWLILEATRQGCSEVMDTMAFPRGLGRDVAS